MFEVQETIAMAIAYEYGAIGWAIIEAATVDLGARTNTKEQLNHRMGATYTTNCCEPNRQYSDHTWTSIMPKTVEPILPVFSILGYGAIILGTLEVQGTISRAIHNL